MGTTKHIILFGAGKSATVLIEYLGRITLQNKWICTIADIDLPSIQSKIKGKETLIAHQLQVNNDTSRKSLIATADVVISMLPPSLHILVAKDCLELRKHLLTASYIDDAIKAMVNDIVAADLLFLGEMGLDPGIDHMSAMRIIDQIQSIGGKIHSFKSHCGGLVAPENDTNPWHYKISWNPRNVVTAGKAGATFKEHNAVKVLPYQQIFSNCETVEINGLGKLAYYPNRNSLSYIPVYGLNEASTFIRTTLRYPSFCSGWQKMVEAGLTSDEEEIDTNGLSYAEFFSHFFERNAILINTNQLKEQFEYLGINSKELINKGKQAVSTILQQILEDKWKLNKGDKDMIVMLHEIDYALNGINHAVRSSLIVKGDDELNTAMAKTVGLPLGIAATLLLENKITVRGLHIPIIQEIYHPVLTSLATEGIEFSETDIII